MSGGDNRTITHPCVATIGTFDGVHRGHKFVLSQVIRRACACGLESLVVTFPNHPLQVLRKDFEPQFLTVGDEKCQLLQATGVDRVELVEFTPQLAQMSAYEFMSEVLKRRFNVSVLVIGYDNHFGHGNSSFHDYVKYGKALGIQVVGCRQCVSDDEISSTSIRRALLQGDVEKARQLLGYPYFLQGEVVKGFQNGHKLGFPTANLLVDSRKLVPANGAYFVRSSQEGYGMLNIGMRPTLHNGSQRSIEAHLFEFEGNLYGTTLKVELLHRLRGEKEFSSLEELKQQLSQDEKACLQLLSQLST